MAENDDMFGGTSGFGFPQIDAALRPQTEEERAAMALETYEHAAHYARCFGTPDGKYVLNDMMKLALMGPRFDATPFSIDTPHGKALADGMTMAFQGFYREGSACWYFHVTQLLTRAEQGPPTAQDDKPARRKK